jgi:hypothetical protein
MTDPNYESIRLSLLQHAAGEEDGGEKMTNILKQLEILNKAEAAQKEPETPEPTGAKAWFEKHSSDLIKVGGTITTVILVGFVESKFDVIFRSKASKYL